MFYLNALKLKPFLINFLNPIHLYIKKTPQHFIQTSINYEDHNFLHWIYHIYAHAVEEQLTQCIHSYFISHCVMLPGVSATRSETCSNRSWRGWWETGERRCKGQVGWPALVPRCCHWRDRIAGWRTTTPLTGLQSANTEYFNQCSAASCAFIGKIALSCLLMTTNYTTWLQQ